MMHSQSERLNKYLALHMGISRREADEHISRGHITIDGIPAQLGARVQEGETVAFKDKPVTLKQHYTYLKLNKPRGYVCSRRQQGDTPTIYTLIPANYHSLKPVGRLDADSSGLLLLSDDGDFTFAMTHPKFYKQKTYHVTLDHALEPLHHQMINDYGVQLEDGPSKLTLERLHEDNSKAWKVIMSEGRNRQIRRTFAALGYTVKTLHRTKFGAYTLDSLQPGKLQQVEKHL